MREVTNYRKDACGGLLASRKSSQPYLKYIGCVGMICSQPSLFGLTTGVDVCEGTRIPT